MENDTTTAPVTDVQAAAAPVEPAQPATDTPVDAPDVQSQAEPSESQPAAEQNQPSAPEVDDKLQKFAKSQGLELDSPNAIKAAQLAMKQRAEATRNYQQSKELEKTVTQASDQYAEAEAQQTGRDPELLKTVRAMQVQNAVRDFWDTPLPNGERPDRGMEQAMIAEVQAKPYLAGDLEALYATAVFKAGSNVDSVKSQAKRETLETLAQNQQAAVPRGSATNPSITPGEKPFSELSIAEMEKKLGFVRQ